ncbi:hypothetical protein BA1_18676 [Bacillus xiamenensis]|nr:hypothetical protein BA1_18676 [Bacillus xiamenensis]
MALYAEMMNATNDGKSISPMNFDKKAFQDSEIYKGKRIKKFILFRND